jgi:hypothetical protein
LPPAHIIAVSPLYSFSLRCFDPRPPLTTHLHVHTASEVPGYGSNDDGNTDKAHSDGERRLVTWCKARVEQLSTHCTTDLAVTVCECDRESRACCTIDRLDSPWPHHDIPVPLVSSHGLHENSKARVPSGREASCEECCCVHASDVRVCVFHCVACFDGDHEEQRNRRERYSRCAC